MRSDWPASEEKVTPERKQDLDGFLVGTDAICPRVTLTLFSFVRAEAEIEARRTRLTGMLRGDRAILIRSAAVAPVAGRAIALRCRDNVA